MKTAEFQSTMMSQMENGPQVNCDDIDFEAIENAGNQVLQQVVNVDLSNYQFDLEKLIDQATLLGLNTSEFKMVEEPMSKLYGYAKCMDKRS